MAGLRLLLSLLLLLLLLLLLVPPVSGLGAQRIEILEDFNLGTLERWEAKEVKGLTRYSLVSEDPGAGNCLKAECAASASGLVLEKDYRLQDFPILSWRWKVEGILPDGDASRRSRDDYAARIYVIFPHWFFPRTRTLNYIWANRLQPGTLLPSPATSRSMMIAVESGNERAGEWILERRNVLEDYRWAFGEDPPPVGAIAVMTDADDTGGRAVAWYDDLAIATE